MGEVFFWSMFWLRFFSGKCCNTKEQCDNRPNYITRVNLEEKSSKIQGIIIWGTRFYLGRLSSQCELENLKLNLRKEVNLKDFIRGDL